MSKTQKKSNEGIEKLLAEATAFKEIIQNKLQADPDNLAEHQMYCTYVRRILEIHKTLFLTRSDPETVLITTLKCAVLTLIEKGEAQSAEVVGRHLEIIGEKVRGKWLDYKEPDAVIRKSEPSSRRRSLPSEIKRPRKSNNASNAP